MTQHRSFATFNIIGRNKKLPPLETVRAYIVGAGGGRNDLALWEQAWTRLSAKIEADKIT